MKRILSLVAFACVAVFVSRVLAIEALADDDYWVAPMKKVHEKFQGKANTILSVGDSITVSGAYFSCFRWAKDPSFKDYQKYVDAFVATGSQDRKMSASGWTTNDVLGSLDKAIEDPPEAVLLMIGTNDVGKVDQAAYEKNLGTIVQKCLDKGCVVIMSTIPPRKGFGLPESENQRRVPIWNAMIHKVAKEKGCPVREFHAAIMKRQPETWAGTLLSDGVHPSGGKTQDLSDANTKTCGYALMNKLALEAYAAVCQKVFGR